MSYKEPDYRVPRLAGLIKKMEMKEAGTAIKEAEERIKRGEVVYVGRNHYQYVNSKWELVV